MMVNSEWYGFNLYLHEWLILMVNVYVNVLVKIDPMGVGPGKQSFRTIFKLVVCSEFPKRKPKKTEFVTHPYRYLDPYRAYSRWWFQTLFLNFIPCTRGFMIQFDFRIFFRCVGSTTIYTHWNYKSKKAPENRSLEDDRFLFWGTFVL